ncbi:hypothetical protein GCM10022224_013920 [Nonomuraea antimicrobica]|uniref:Uncharacterized protein n=1 Tax=Nonomuraea antimicrobica TaxID=561173 RepID=A0ABP7B7U3_9ACTN
MVAEQLPEHVTRDPPEEAGGRAQPRQRHGRVRGTAAGQRPQLQPGCPAPRAGEGVGDALAQDSDHRVGLSSGTLPIRYGTGALTFLKSEFIIAEQQMSTLSGVNDDIESPLIGTA